jgi:hypothetical protein
MTGASRCLLWLTALTTASLTITGCGSGGGHPSAAASTSPSSARPSGPSRSVRPSRLPTPAPSTPATSTPAPRGTLPGDPAVAADGAGVEGPSLLVISDGSATVHVGRRSVLFPGPVTDAVIAPNGTSLAFVDGQGNIAVSHLDGTAVRVLTSTERGVRRAQPTFEDGGSEIVFSERGHDGVWRLKEVASDGQDGLTTQKPDPTVPETVSDHGHDTGASAAWFQASHSDTARSVLVYEHRTSAGAVKVYLTDRNQRGFGATPLLPGRAPAVSPTGDAVAFIGAGGQIEVQTLPVPGLRPHPDQITWGAQPTGHLAWSPDGRRLVFSARRDVESVSTIPARPGHNPARVVLRHPGVASLGTRALPTVGRYAGDPVSMALDVSRAHFIGGDGQPTDESAGLGVSWATTVTLVSATDPTAAAPAAAMAGGGPVLFVRDGHLDPAVRDEIVRVLRRPRGMRVHPTVDIVGSTDAVPDSVASELTALGFRVRRFDPLAAADDAAKILRGAAESYVVVSGSDLPAIASSVGNTTPVLLTDGSTMPPSTAARIDRMPHIDGTPKVYAVGQQAQAAVRSSWLGKQRFRIVDVGGPDPYANSLEAVQRLYDAPGRVGVTTGSSWQDTLIATMVGPTLVVGEGHGLATAARAWLASSEPALRDVYVFGGTARLAGAVGAAAYGDRFVVTRSPTDIRG